MTGLVEHAEFHDAIGPGVGEGIEENGVDDTKDGTCGGDAESEGEDRSEGEGGALAEFAEGVAEVGEEGVHEHLG